MASKQPPLQYEVESSEQLSELLAQPGLKVVELYSSWCGNCKSVLPTFKRIRLEKDDEALLKFLVVSAEYCDVMPQAGEYKGSSEPVFFLFRNGICKPENVVVGANTPVLNTLIMDLTRTGPDSDEPEANPFYQAMQAKKA